LDKVNYFFDGWDPLVRVFVVGSLSYILLVFLLKVAGKRTLAQMSGFDFIITVAIGSTFGRLITARGVTLAESASAFLLLIFLQLGFAWLNMKYSWFSRLAKSQPTLLYYKGSFLEDNIRRCRVNKDEVLGVIREQGIESLDEVEAVVLETSGGWSVVRKGKREDVDRDKSTLTPLTEKEEKKLKEKN
jgi:uncharacterized membrane protein YcaP (DUF421 family)